MAVGSRFIQSLRNPWQWIGAGVVLLVLGAIALGPIYDPPRSHPGPPLLTKARAINLAMFSYSNDNEHRYPIGKSSTEVFQKLLDEKYVEDPTIFYFAMPGKIKPTSHKLNPENVSWDLTIPVNENDSDELPTVFLTGYRMQYKPGGCAIPLGKVNSGIHGLAVSRKSMSTAFIRDDGRTDGIVPDVISQGFNPAGKSFQQLTPDGSVRP